MISGRAPPKSGAHTPGAPQGSHDRDERARHGRTAGPPAAAQGLGYLAAATGPLAVGLVHGATGGWRGGLVLLPAVPVAQAVAGMAAARPRPVDAAA